MKQLSLFAIVALFALQACSDDSVPSTSSGAGAGGAAAGAAGSGGSGGGSGGAGSGGASAGSAGALAGSGGSLAGSGGSGGAAAGSGGSSPTQWQQVQTLFATSCGKNACHKDAPFPIYQNPPNGLWSVLSTPFPDGTSHCVGTTLVVPNDVANSFLITVTSSTTSKVGCLNKGVAEMIDRMPDGCSTEPGAEQPCLAAAQIDMLKSWILAGAPH